MAGDVPTSPADPPTSRLDQVLLDTLSQLRSLTHSSSPETVAAGIEACEAELDELAEPFSFVSSRPHYEAAIRCTLAYAFWRVQDFDECRAELQQIEDLIPRIARESAAVATRFEARLATLKELQGLYFEDEESVASEAEQADTLAAAADTEMTEITDTFPASNAGAKVAHECANAIPTILQPLPAVTSRTPSPLRRKAEAPPTVTPPRSPAGSSFLSITGTPASASAEKRRRVSLPEVEQIAFESDQLLAFERLERMRVDSEPPRKTVRIAAKASLGAGEKLYLVGSLGVLGGWAVSNGLRLHSLRSNAFTGAFDLEGAEQEHVLEAKLVRVLTDGSAVWERQRRGNRVLDPQTLGEEEVVLAWEE